VSLARVLSQRDLVFNQILFIVGLPWVGVAAKQGPSHVIYWLLAMALFYVPSAMVAIHLNKRMPIEGGLYQWAKLGFSEMLGFLVAWNLWLFTILLTSEVGLQVSQYLRYIMGPKSDALTTAPWFIALVSALCIGLLVVTTVRGLGIGKWLHAWGGALMLTTFATLSILPWLNVAHGTLPSYHPFATAVPVVSIMSLNLLGKMGFGALGGFEYVAIHAGECHEPERTIGRSVAVASPIIALMFILGTSSVLAFIPVDQIDLIAPIPQVLSAGFGTLGGVAGVATIAIFVLLCVRVAQSSVAFVGNTRLPMVAGWDGVLPPWFTRLHERYRTPVNSTLFAGGAAFTLSIVGLIGVGKQEAFQLLWNAAAIFYALTYLVMFALPLIGLRDQPKPPLWLRLMAVSGFLMTLLFVVLSILPIVQVESRLSFALKISTLIAVANVIGVMIYRRSRGNPIASPRR
jgi:amino acid transporter